MLKETRTPGGPVVGIKDDLVTLAFQSDPATGASFTHMCDPVTARKLADRINAMADVLDPTRTMRHAADIESPSGDGGGKDPGERVG